MTNASIPKFRPVLSASQITHLMHLCRRDSSNESLSCISVLAAFEYKINNNAIAPAYTQSITPSLADSLGFSEPMDALSKLTITDESASEENLYQLWMLEPSSLSIKQLQAVRAYRYKNNKMTVDEEAKYEAEIMGGA